jgi:8-oxo-dGTP pyrophosphatase MutT (NUDIX family)
MRATEFTQPQAAGCIIVAEDTGRWCLQQRSDTVSDPGVWSTWGGGREPGETLEQCVRRELAEEGGYVGPLKLEPLSRNSQYATFIGHVPHEFEPQINKESKDWCWTDRDQLPEPMHPGLVEALAKLNLNESRDSVEQKYLWHGSRQPIELLEPRQSVDTGGAVGSNQNAIYATADPKVAIAMGLTTPGSDTGMFPNDPQMVLFSGKIRKGENVYLHKLPMNGPDGKPQFVQGGNTREFHSVPGVKGIKPLEIKAVSVDKYLNLIRTATPQDLELRKKYMKQDVDENFADGKVKGKSRPGRVKRAGASCNGSVSDLRARAKKYGGERGRMYHWCANMKSGRKK